MSGLGIQKRGCGIARVQKAEGGSSKPGLYANINKRKKLGISRPKSKSTISKEAYSNMKAGFPKRKKFKDGTGEKYYSGDKYYKLERERHDNFKKSEKELDKKYKEIQEKERDFDYMNSIHPEDSTAEPMNFKSGGLVKKDREKKAKGGIARDCGKVMSNRRKTTKYY